MTNPDHLADARTALDDARWDDALAALERTALEHTALEGTARAAALEIEAQAAYGAGEFERSIDAWERLYRHALEHDDHADAARAAAMTAMHLMIDTGLMAPVRGWLASADRLLEGREPGPAHAIVAMTRTYERFMCGDMDAARERAAEAIALGRATDVNPAVVIGMTASARVRIFDGDVEGGIAGLNEVGALLMAGGADPLTTGMMYCEIICAAQGLSMYELASEWTEVMERWRHGAAFGGIHGRCRVHRAEILRVSGPADEAEAEALGACDELRPWMRREYGWPLAELGMIRLRRGDLEGAEEAFLEAHAHAWSPHPGLALLRLAQGDIVGALQLITDAVERPLNIPSKERPPFGDLRLAPLLEAQSEIAFAAADLDLAASTAARLGEIGRRFASPFIEAAARLADARAALLGGAPDLAIAAAEAAIAIWSGAGAPYETACARLVLADALELAGRGDAARLERTGAAAGFRRYGAKLLEATAERLADGGAEPIARPPDADLSVRFAAEGGQRTIGFAGRASTTRDLKGMRLIARLAASPGREFHALDLVAAENGVLRPSPSHPDHGPAGAESGLPVLDDTAREAYRRRLREIDDDIDEARALNDPARAELAERDRDYLIAELQRAIGLGGRERTVGGSPERARTSVTRSIRYAIDQIETTLPELAARLRAEIRTGVYCSYEPDPLAPLVWTF